MLTIFQSLDTSALHVVNVFNRFESVSSSQERENTQVQLRKVIF